MHQKITFSLSIFIGAFLLFQVQPIIGKHILPWFGGSSSVWITAVLFFQVLLLCGYLYVYLISRLSLKKQVLLHSVVLLVGVYAILSALYTSQIPILPEITWGLPDKYPPVVQTLWILTLGTGFPYFILSTTSVLLQKWFVRAQSQNSPYIFYSLSNAASLFALISYPFLVEPLFQLNSQGLTWSIGYVLYSVLLLLCCSQMLLVKDKVHKNSLKTEIFAKRSNKIGKKRLFLWMLLPAISSLMLLATTNLLTLSIASVPFLWLLPMIIYLTTFILCFSGPKWYMRSLYGYISLLSGFLALVFLLSNLPYLMTSIAIYILLLFSACMLCHGELYALRPDPKRLDIYYLLIALGSAMSGVLVGIIAPLVFTGVWETYIGFYLTFLLTMWMFLHYKDSFIYHLLQKSGATVKEISTLALIGYPILIMITPLVLTGASDATDRTIKTWRNFYGVVSVKIETTKTGEKRKTLTHGTILHGDQYVGKRRFEPTSYYGKTSGVGLSIRHHPSHANSMKIGVVGLGTGTIAAYGREGDEITFFEINPQIVDIAKSQFTYIQDSKARIKITLGDGRLSLAKEIVEKKALYDILVIDAFSDDAIPLHLLTKEAFGIYLKRVHSQSGVIAIHISNRHVDLKPVVSNIAKYYELQYAFVLNNRATIDASSEWALLSYDKTIFQNPDIQRMTEAVGENKNANSLWTDNYSNLFQALK